MKTLFTLFLIGSSLWSYSQSIDNQVISSAGDVLKNGNASLTGTIGEPLTETYETANLTLTQGFHQPSYLLTSIMEHGNRDIDITLFPNPTADVVEISTSMRGIKYTVLDMKGMLLSKGTFKSNLEKIDLTQFADGVFLVNLYSKKHDFSKTYQVVKK